MKIRVEFYLNVDAVEDRAGPVLSYTMDHNDPAQRRVLGEQCRNAFEAGQCVLTYPAAA